jgi:ATP-binding cassette, subfamily C, bacterial exporter for protease/lipase
MTPPSQQTATNTELSEAFRKVRPAFIKATWFSLFSSLLVLAPSAYMLEVYDRVVNSRSHLTLAMLTLLVLGAYALMEVLEWARSEIMHEAGLEVDAHLNGRVFAALFGANLRRVPGGTVQTMVDLRMLREFLHSPALLAVMEFPVAAMCLALLFAISPVLGWSAMLGALVQGLVSWLNERSTRPPLSAASKSAIAAQQYADGTLRNAEVIEALGMLRDIHRRWIEKQRQFLGLQALASTRAGTYTALAKVTQIVMGSALLGIGALLLLDNDLHGGGGMMIVGSILGGRMVAPLVSIVMQWRSVVQFRDAWGRIQLLLSQVPSPPKGMPLPAPRGKLTVEPLMAAAPGNSATILRGVQFSLEPGEVLAVVGPSASGKTTLARLLVGLWPALAGKVRLDGADIYGWNKSELGPHIGYLPQNVELLEGTVAENISRFGPPELAKVEAAARAVGLHEFIQSLPLGYDSPVGRDGAILSGGQRQRVALARALYGDPVFVVLDEPNSSLDEVGDAALAAALVEGKKRGTTFVVMTHRTSVLAVVDKMLLLRDGSVAAFGPRDEVLAALRRAAEQSAGAPSPSPHSAPGLAAPAA